MLAAIGDDTNRNRYQLEHQLVRSNGLGDWSNAIEEALSGPASQYLIPDAQTERIQLTKLCSEGDWQHEAVASLKLALEQLRIASEAVPVRSDMKRWFRLFTTLRNKTRGHGATRPADSGQAAIHLFHSIKTVYENFHLFQRPWVYLYRNLSGKYRVTSLGNDAEVFDYLKKESTHSFPDGVYLHFDSPRMVPLIMSDADLSDFFIPNGGFSDKNYDLLSYSTDNKRSGDSSSYLTSPGTLQSSETHGHGELLARGNCFSNAPEPARDYVARPKLEEELMDLLMDDRHPVITLLGTGGVGKTSATLKVIETLYQEKRYEVIIWFSARDIDLRPSGPRAVRPRVLSQGDVADHYAALVLSDVHVEDKAFDRKEYFEQQLRQSDGGTCLFVFDNFETVQNPVEMFNWIEYHVRPPNKVLITTRLRNFKGDYPLEVQGMTDREAQILADQTALHLKVKSLLTRDNVDEIVSQSGGHPYVIKILIGEVASSRGFRSPRHVVAGSEEILTALFERTYKALSPCGQRGFLTLAAWNSAVPRIALEAVLIRSTEERSEVEAGIQSLLDYSLGESRVAGDERQEFISLPLAASSFGKKQLQINVLKSAILSDVEILQMFTPSSIADMNLDLGRRLRDFVKNMSDRIDKGAAFGEYEAILDMVCRAYNPGWLLLAQWHIERGTNVDFDAAVSDIQNFLQSEPTGQDAAEAWRMLAHTYYKLGDALGEIHAFVERAQLESVPFYDVSNTAKLLNSKYQDLNIDYDGKRKLAQRVLEVLGSRREECKPDDLSRMAWLALHLSDTQKAEDYVREGLEADGSNLHCLRIAQRLNMEL